MKEWKDSKRSGASWRVGGEVGDLLGSRSPAHQITPTPVTQSNKGTHQKEKGIAELWRITINHPPHHSINKGSNH